MHNTRIKLKDDTEVNGVIWDFRPKEGYLTLVGMVETKIQFNDIVSAVTENERISVNEIGDCDELERARKHLRKARKYGWDGMNENTPLQEWEKV